MSTIKNQNEQYFEWWLDDLVKQGYVISYEREPKTFTLLDFMFFTYNKTKQLKTKISTKTETFTFLNDIQYTPDYKAIFTEKALGKYVKFLSFDSEKGWIIDTDNFSKYENFLTCQKEGDNYIVYFDVKPPAFVMQFASGVSSAREFPLKQRLMFSEHNIYVNKVVPIGSANCLFKRTFIPERYKFTDKTMKPRKIK